MIKITNKDRITAFAVILGFVSIVLMCIFLFTPNSKEVLVPGNVALTVDGSKLSVGFYNYFYSAATSPEIMVEMERLYEDFDQSIPLKEQIFDAESGMTWAEYIDDTVKEQISFLVKAYNMGMSEGIYVFKEQQERIDSIVSSLNAEAENLSIGTDDYTRYTYGEYVGIKTVEKILEMSYIAQNFYEYYLAKYEVNQNEYSDFYLNNKENLISAEYICCEIVCKESESARLKEELQKLLLPQISYDNFETYINENLSDYIKTISEEKTMFLNYDGCEAVKIWLFDFSRKAGDKAVISDDQSGNIYIILAVADSAVDETVTCSARELAMRVSDFDGWDELEAVADYIEKQISNSSDSEYSMAVYSDIYMNNAETEATVGGLITDIEHTDGDAEKWLYDSERKRGDFIRLESENGYYLLMFIEKKPSWQFVADREIADKSFKENMKKTSFVKEYAFKYAEGYVN